LLPIVKACIGPDILAGITLAAIGIPKVMGYTKVISTPVITGLYALFLPVLVFALFGSSRHLIVSTDSATPRFPGALLAVIGLTAASAYFHWGEKGVDVVGNVPSGLPHLGFPHITYGDVMMVLPISLSCFIVILAQSAATSRAYALRYRDYFDQNADLIGLSLANVAAGGRSQWSHLTTATVVLMVLLFLTRPLSFLPNAVLAAIVFHIGVKLVDYRGLTEIQRSTPNEFAALNAVWSDQ
jgi:MFS superfamily sulfate permease-like transporter